MGFALRCPNHAPRPRPVLVSDAGVLRNPGLVYGHDMWLFSSGQALHEKGDDPNITRGERL